MTYRNDSLPIDSAPVESTSVALQVEGTTRTALLGYAVTVGGLVLALWICFGRFLFGIGGSLTPIYVVTLGFLIATLHFFAGRAIVRTARLGRRTRPATIAMICLAWFTGILLGLTIPDLTAAGPQTILSGATEPGLGIAIGLANPLGIICIATSIVALVLAHGDLKDRLKNEDD
ncbi:hypothetical protein GCM10022381_33570 [Leifsonia kafniensis]|uniref:MotA/TolQ/ExbB proton channel domain-containing protein n=1 Tax=Leifsonia kafniensis TaxID=475957 RepID=A0ABP7KWN6_9MICO